MRNLMLALAATLAAMPGATRAAEPVPSLPARVDHDLYCQLLVSDVLTRAEQAPADQRTKFAELLVTLRRAEAFYTGSVTAHLSDERITTLGAAASRAVQATDSETRSGQLPLCLDEAGRRSEHYVDRLNAR